MLPVAYIDFEEATNVTGPITKFGGKPWGLCQADWPKSAKKQTPLEFIAQIVLEPGLFPGADNQLAYVFWNPAPLGFDDAAVLVRKRTELTNQPAEGPSLYKIILGPRKFLFREKKQVPCEFTVRQRSDEEPTFTDLKAMFDEDDPESEKVLKAHGLTVDELVNKVDAAKIGGVPHFIQTDEPTKPDDRLLLQLPAGKFPFHMDLGDAGTFFAFLQPDLTAGYAFWECY